MTEKVSTFLDGEMDKLRLEKSIHKLISEKQTIQIYKEYQQIGDVLRGNVDGLGLANGSTDLASRIMVQIEQEPTVLSPNAIVEKPLADTSEHKTIKNKQLAPKWSIAASIAAVVVVGYLTLDQQQSNDPTMMSSMPLLATIKAPQATTPKVAQYASIDEIPQQYLQAHHISAPTVGSYYIQTVSSSD